MDITDEKNVQERVKELYEEELAYFAELSSEGGLVQGRLNVTQNRLENYISTEDTAIAEIGDTYDEAVKRLAASAVDIGYGRKIFRDLQREKDMPQARPHIILNSSAEAAARVPSGAIPACDSA